VKTTHCAEVLSLASTARTRSESADAPEVGIGAPVPQARVLLIHERVEGFFLERLTDRGESLGTTQHDTMDEAMRLAYSEYVLSDWSPCPDDTDPLEYIKSLSGD
jgi:hypothetical protein